MRWHGPSSYTAEQLSAVSGPTERTALDEAVYVVFSILSQGLVLADEAKSKVLSAGVAERTMRRAKQLLEVRSVRQGFGRGSKLLWQLREENELTRRLREREVDELADSLFTPDADDDDDPLVL